MSHKSTDLLTVLATLRNQPHHARALESDEALRAGFPGLSGAAYSALLSGDREAVFALVKQEIETVFEGSATMAAAAYPTPKVDLKGFEPPTGVVGANDLTVTMTTTDWAKGWEVLGTGVFLPVGHDENAWKNPPVVAAISNVTFSHPDENHLVTLTIACQADFPSEGKWLFGIVRVPNPGYISTGEPDFIEFDKPIFDVSARK